MKILHWRIVILLVSLVSISLTCEAKENRHHGHPAQPGEFDFYLLSLSWSPEFCASPAGQKPQKQEQCSKPLGLVVHGLWPQDNNGNWPENCGAGKSDVPDSIAEIAEKATPPMPSGDPEFIDHEWDKHGTCSGLEMSKYFQAIKQAAETIQIPSEIKDPRSEVTMSFNSLAQIFQENNPGLKSEMLAVNPGGGGYVQELHFCLDKQLTLQNCPGWSQTDERKKFIFRAGKK